MRNLLILLLLLSAGCIPLRHDDDPDAPPKPSKSVSVRVETAINNYRTAVADDYAEMAKAEKLPETVIEAGIIMSEKETKHWRTFLTEMAEIMEPEIGSTELDAAKYRKLCEGVAQGFRPSSSKKRK